MIYRKLNSKEGVIDLMTASNIYDKIEMDKIEKEWTEQNRNKIIKNGEHAKISCITCWKLLNKEGINCSNEYLDYNYLEFVDKQEHYGRHREKDQWIKQLIEVTFNFFCPAREHKHSYSILAEELPKGYEKNKGGKKK
jgi:hypothetical protein